MSMSHIFACGRSLHPHTNTDHLKKRVLQFHFCGNPYFLGSISMPIFLDVNVLNLS
jgi:hypothetical protein